MEVKIGPYVDDLTSLETRQIDINIDDYDMWNLDHTLAHIIYPALIKFKESTNAHPSQMTDKEWDDILDKMIFSFGQMVNDYKDEPENVQPREEYDIYQNKIQEGVELFGKHFRSLWI